MQQENIVQPLQRMDKNKWNDEQKKMLLDLVKTHIKPSGTIDWVEVAQQLPFSKQRRDTSVKNDNIFNQRRNHQWVASEEQTLLRTAEMYGKNWEQITHNFFPGLTPQKVKNKYAQLIKQQDLDDQSTSVVQQIVQSNIQPILVQTAQANPIQMVSSLPNINLPSVISHFNPGFIPNNSAQSNIFGNDANQAQTLDFNLLKNINEISVIDSARLFMLDSARGQ